MSMSIIIFIFIVYILFSLKHSITHLTQTVEDRIDTITRMVADPTDAAITVGARVANKAVNKVKSIINK